MTDETRVQLELWLRSDDPVQRRHAEHRLANLPPDPSPVPLADSLAALRLGWKMCPYAEHGPGCGCSGVKCWAWCGPRIITLHDCVICLKPNPER